MKILPKLYFSIVGIYILYPLIYIYSFYGRNDYLFINNYGKISRGILVIIALLVGNIIYFAIRYKLQQKITSLKLILHIVCSSALLVGFWFYTFVVAVVDFSLHGW